MSMPSIDTGCHAAIHCAPPLMRCHATSGDQAGCSQKAGKSAAGRLGVTAKNGMHHLSSSSLPLCFFGPSNALQSPRLPVLQAPALLLDLGVINRCIRQAQLLFGCAHSMLTAWSLSDTGCLSNNFALKVLDPAVKHRAISGL